MRPPSGPVWGFLYFYIKSNIYFCFMKKGLLFIALICGTFLANAQVNVVYFEDFSNGMPSEYNIVDKDGKTPHANLGWPANTAWRVVNEAARSISWYNPIGASDDWMITGAIDIPVASDVANKTLLYWFGLAVDPQYPDGYEVYVGTAGNAPEDFTDKVFSIVAENSSTGLYRAVDISAYEGQTVYVAFRNNSNDKFVLIIDDIMIAETAPNDASALRVTNKGYVPEGTTSFSMEVSNVGSTPITQLTMHYTVDGGTEETAEITGLNIAPLGKAVITHPTPFIAASGIHEVDLWVSLPNGADDADPGNNATSLQFSFFDPANTVPRRTIVEGYSSSTCAPCAPANTAFHTLYNSLPVENRPISIKLQQYFPGTGDPYTTLETVYRCIDYYGVTGIPDSRIDGDFWSGLTGDINATILTNARNRPALATFDLKYALDTAAHSVTITGTVTPAVDLLDGTRLILAIKETQTTKNVKTNGETIFRNVLKKIVNGINGIDMSGVLAGEAFPIDVTYTFPGDYRLPSNGTAAQIIDLETEHSVENFANLRVTGWVEFPRDRYILNAAEAEEATVGVQTPTSLEAFQVFPNPAIREAFLDIRLTEALDNQIVLFDAHGQVVRTVFQGVLPAGDTRIPVSIGDLAAGTYFLHLRSAQGLTIRNLNVVR